MQLARKRSLPLVMGGVMNRYRHRQKSADICSTEMRYDVQMAEVLNVVYGKP